MACRGVRVFNIIIKRHLGKDPDFKVKMPGVLKLVDMFRIQLF